MSQITITDKIGFALPGGGESFGITQDYLYLLKPHRQPMILIDSIDEVNLVRKDVRGTKLVRLEDPYVRAHFPGDPMIPAAFVVEAMAQVSGCLMNLIYFGDRGVRFAELSVAGFLKLDQPPFNVLAESKIKHGGLAVPGDRLELHARVALQRTDLVAFHVSSNVGARTIASGEIILAYPPYTKIAWPVSSISGAE